MGQYQDSAKANSTINNHGHNHFDTIDSTTEIKPIINNHENLYKANIDNTYTTSLTCKLWGCI